MRPFCWKMMIITMAIIGASFLGLAVLPAHAGGTGLGGTPWIWDLSGSDKGAFMVRFDGLDVSHEIMTGYGLNFFIFKPFTIEPAYVADPIVIDTASRKIEGTLLLWDITDANSLLGKIVIKGSYSKDFSSMSLKGTIYAMIEGGGGQFTEGVKVNISGHRFEEGKTPMPLAVGIEKGKLTSKSVKGNKLSIAVEPSDLAIPGVLPNRLGIMSGGGAVKTNNVQFNLDIEDSAFFLTDTGKAYGQFLSNLFDAVSSGTVKPTDKTDQKFKLTLTLKRFDLKENVTFDATVEALAPGLGE
jgi:hypothetical protein